MSDKAYEKLSTNTKTEDWMNKKWRPLMGYSYMLTCIADFVVFPVLWSVLQSISKGQVNVQWQPITLQGAGLYHIAMGAVLGIAAYGRTQEKLGGANNGGLNVGTTYTPPAPINGGANNGGFNPSPSGSSAFGTPAAGGFGAASNFDTPATTETSAAVTSAPAAKPKKAGPPPQVDPVL